MGDEAKEDRERLSRLEKVLGLPDSSGEGSCPECGTKAAEFRVLEASIDRPVAEKDEWKAATQRLGIEAAEERGRTAEWKARAEKAAEGQNALAAEVRKMRERAEAAEVNAERLEDCHHSEAPCGACRTCLCKALAESEAALAQAQDWQRIAEQDRDRMADRVTEMEAALAALKKAEAEKQKWLGRWEDEQIRAEAAEAALAKVTEERDALKEAFNSKDTRRYQNGVEDGRVAAEKERDAALKACAEMRKALERFKVWADKWSEDTRSAAAFRATEQYAEMKYALSSNCGKGYASPDEQRALMERAWDDGRSFGGDEAVMATKKSASEQRALDLAALLGREG